MTGAFKHDSVGTVKAALSFQRPDRLPVCGEAFYDEFVDKWRKQRNQGPDADIEDYYGRDFIVSVAKEELLVTQMREVRREGEDVYRDDGWGRIVRAKAGAAFVQPVERLLTCPADLDRIRFDPPDLNVRYGGFLREVAHHRKRGRAVFVKIGGPFIRSTFFRGEMEFLVDLADDEDFARAVAEKVGEHLLQIGLESLKRADAYDCGLWISDDMCSAKAPMFSPRIFERVFLPVYKRIVSTVKDAGARWVILHCDGNLRPLLDMIVEAGVDGINPVEPAAGLDVPELMAKYGGRLSFIGGICNTHILPGGDPDEIRRHVQTVVDAGRDGGLIIGTHSVGPDISVESYELYRRIAAERFESRTNQ
ncbi:MAG: uroporphyrinogen decarboxylase family protein [Phycisphaerae bacterium]|jgi:uroporphyrinogen decarboxylase|nr:uroporphyrinogen decarboxylase family protein [Phycisphaerae bacterium]